MIARTEFALAASRDVPTLLQLRVHVLPSQIGTLPSKNEMLPPEGEGIFVLVARARLSNYMQIEIEPPRLRRSIRIQPARHVPRP